MVALDGDAGAAADADAFDHVGIQRALGEEFGAADLVAFGVEHIDEGGADDLALLFGIADAGKAAQEHLPGIGMDQRDVVMVAEQADDFIGLAAAHQAGIHEDAGQLVADRFMDQDGGHRRIHAARQAADHLALADLLADLLDHGGAECVHVPVRLDAGNVQDEIADHVRPARGMRHFGMELDAVHPALFVGDHRIGRIV